MALSIDIVTISGQHDWCGRCGHLLCVIIKLHFVKLGTKTVLD